LASGCGPYQPRNIVFPKRNGRKFRSDWYQSFPWLEYSPLTDSAYCFYCRAFPTFISDGFCQWAKASFKSFPQHENSMAHKDASAKLAG